MCDASSWACSLPGRRRRGCAGACGPGDVHRAGRSHRRHANGLVRAGAFDFAHTTLTDGAQTPPTDPALFGAVGGQVDPTVATLNSFDGNSTIAIPGAFGFVSLGVGGKLALNLLSPVATGGPLYLYIGEVGNNGEVAASGVTVLSTTVGVPEPATLAVLGLGLAGLVGLRRAS